MTKTATGKKASLAAASTTKNAAKKAAPVSDAIAAKKKALQEKRTERSLQHVVHTKNSIRGKVNGNGLGSTRKGESKKLQDLVKPKAKSAPAYKQPAANSLQFRTWINAVDLALFFCPRKFLDKKEVVEFVQTYFKDVPVLDEANPAEAKKKLTDRLEKTLKRGASEEGNSVYNTIVASGNGLQLVYKYKLDPKRRAQVKSGVKFQPVFPKSFDSSIVKEINSKKSYALPVFKKRASKKATVATKETAPAAAESTPAVGVCDTAV